MNLNEIAIAIRQGFQQVGYVESIYNGDVYDLWNNNEVRYLSGCFDIENINTTQDVKTYVLVVYAADRLIEDGSNRLACIDAAEQAIETMLNFLTDNGQNDNLWIDEVRQYTPFEQKFADNLAGVWCRVNLKTTNDINLCT